MAGSLLMPTASHVHSISAPSPSHPIILQIENEFNRLNGWEASLSTSSSIHPKAKMSCDGLCCLTILSDCTKDLLQLRLTQLALCNNRHDISVKEVLDESLDLLDACSISRDVTLQMKEHVQGLQLVLHRRRGGEEGLGIAVNSYLSSMMRKRKEMGKCLIALKRNKFKNGLTPLLDRDEHLAIVINVLRELRSRTIFVLESILSFTEVPKQRRTTCRSLLSKWIGTRQVVCEVEAEAMKNVERVHASLYALYGLNSCQVIDPVQEQYTHRLLEEMGASIQGLQDRLDCLFRCLVQTRVSLLNILNH